LYCKNKIRKETKLGSPRLRCGNAIFMPKRHNGIFSAAVSVAKAPSCRLKQPAGVAGVSEI